MAAAEISRRARWYVVTAVLGLVAWQLAAVLNAPHRMRLSLGLFGFVFPMIFGKAYSLIPSYFATDLAAPRLLLVQFPLTLLGAIGLVVHHSPVGPDWIGHLGGFAWLAAVCVFLGMIAVTIANNPTGAETGTSESNADRRRTDRIANAAVPIAIGYLLVGSYETAAVNSSLLPALLGTYPPRSTHLLAAGAAGLLILALGFRLIPRFLVVTPADWVPVVILPTGAIGPVLLAIGLPAGPILHAGAGLETIALLGFGLALMSMFHRSERRRVGFYGVVTAGIAGIVGVGLGMSMAIAGIDATTVFIHRRINLLGFLGLMIIGISYQFYPPAVGEFRIDGDRLALAAIVSISLGIVLEVMGSVLTIEIMLLGGRLLALVGALLHAGLILGLFYQRYWSTQG